MISCSQGRSKSHSLTLSMDPANVNWPSSLAHNFWAGVVSGGVVTDIYNLTSMQSVDEPYHLALIKIPVSKISITMTARTCHVLGIQGETSNCSHSWVMFQLINAACTRIFPNLNIRIMRSGCYYTPIDGYIYACDWFGMRFKRHNAFLRS